jgi:hypothetical protein
MTLVLLVTQIGWFPGVLSVGNAYISDSMFKIQIDI